MSSVRHTLVKFLFLLISVVYVANAQKPCCLPNQYQASLGQTIVSVMNMNTSTAVGTLSVGRETFAYDFTSKLVGSFNSLNVTTSVGVFPVKSHTISDYKLSAKWTIVNNKCTVEKLTQNMSSPCISDDATYLGSLVIGGVLNGHQWIVKSGAINSSYTVTDKCIPIDITTYTYSKEGLTLTTNTFADFVPNIDDPGTFFTVPKDCPKPPEDWIII
ncbi:uncharacterized protein [Antedon mediterranea]|uniref:uncharacterized protein n=1 Tax=Antedon mediterranea TaxID=105859 RepID=UPI003AF71B90